MLKERPEPVYEVKIASRRVERQLDKVDDKIYPKVAEAIESPAAETAHKGPDAPLTSLSPWPLLLLWRLPR